MWSGDDIGGGQAAARHLLELGHRRIAFLGDEFDNPFGFTSSRHRYIGLRAGPVGSRLWRSTPSSWRSAPTAATRHASWRLGCWPGTDEPTAVFAASDTQALGVISAAHEAGLRVPDDLSVVGYDDIEIADYLGLTTVRQHLFESGRLGAEPAAPRDPGPLGGPALDRPAARGRGPGHHGGTTKEG